MNSLTVISAGRASIENSTFPKTVRQSYRACLNLLPQATFLLLSIPKIKNQPPYSHASLSLSSNHPKHSIARTISLQKPLKSKPVSHGFFRRTWHVDFKQRFGTPVICKLRCSTGLRPSSARYGVRISSTPCYFDWVVSILEVFRVMVCWVESRVCAVSWGLGVSRIETRHDYFGPN